MSAIDECIKRGILSDILEKQKAEVVSLVLTTFNKELYESNLKKDAYSEGEAAGHLRGYSEGEAAGHLRGYSQGREALLKEKVKKKLIKGKSIEVIADELEEDIDAIRYIITRIRENE